MFGQKNIRVGGATFYVARDKNGMVWLYNGAPEKDEENGKWLVGNSQLISGWHDEDGKGFPNVLWSDIHPTKVELNVVL